MLEFQVRSKPRTLLIVAVLVGTLLMSFFYTGITPTSAQGPDGTPPAGGGQPPDGAGGPPGDGTTTNPVLTATCGIITLDGEAGASTTDQIYDSAEADSSDICVINGGSLTLVNPAITKTGDTSSSDQSSFYGLNAAVLVGPDSSVTITGGSVTTAGAGTNGVFATGSGSSVTLTDVSIYAVGDGAHAVMATLGGTMTLNNVDMITTDVHSGAIATDRGSGTITVTGGTVLTSGQDSPGIYSTGIITVSDATITATGAESAVIEGANSIILTNTTLASNLEDKWGVMIYQSFSGDAEGSDGVFTMTGGSLAHTATTGPLFFVTNSTAYITLSGVEVTAGSGILVEAGGTDRWGNSGENGGTVYLTADAQTLTGDLMADNISTINATLQNRSSLTGSINPDNTAQAANLTLDGTSTWNVTADSVLTCLADSGGISDGSVSNIAGNGYTVTYDSSVCTELGGQTYALSGGGYLQPAS
ncbi:MAG: hypothetical protein HY866_20565 [Chloroflexi bacterium]|nr:hypothetical protein [Chloroflexota bacterium]